MPRRPPAAHPPQPADRRDAGIVVPLNSTSRPLVTNKRRRQAMQVRIQRRQHRILRCPSCRYTRYRSPPASAGSGARRAHSARTWHSSPPAGSGRPCPKKSPSPLATAAPAASASPSLRPSGSPQPTCHRCRYAPICTSSATPCRPQSHPPALPETDAPAPAGRGTATTFTPLKFAIGIVSDSDPESELNPPPCRLISTRSRFSGAIVSGVTTRTGTPAIVSSATFAGYSFFDGLTAPFCHLSVPSRRCCSVCGTFASETTRPTSPAPPGSPSSAPAHPGYIGRSIRANRARINDRLLRHTRPGKPERSRRHNAHKRCPSLQNAPRLRSTTLPVHHTTTPPQHRVPRVPAAILKGLVPKTVHAPASGAHFN